MKISIIGTGVVGRTIASKLFELGNEVMLGTRNVSDKLASTAKDMYGNPPFSEWLKEHDKIRLGSFSESAAFGEIIINATLGSNSLEALNQAGEQNISEKILIDVSNPLDFSKGRPPGLLPGLTNTNSLGEEIQKVFPKARVVKTLNTMWCGLMINPGMIGGGDHVNFISGNDSEAKAKVRNLLISFGWKDDNLMDIGDITGARAAESWLPMWIKLLGLEKGGAFNIKIIR